MTYNYRCSKRHCRKRKTLRMPKEDYWEQIKGWKLRWTACPACGCDSLRIDPTLKIRTKRLKCYCDAWPFAHKRNENGKCYRPAEERFYYENY